MKPAYSVIKRPHDSEKTAALAENNKYVFEIYPCAGRKDVAAAVEAQFKVSVTRVNILNVKGKRKMSRTKRGEIIKAPDVKKAIVTLKKGDKIEII